MGMGMAMGMGNREYPQEKNDQLDSDNNNMGESNMIKEKVIPNTLYLTELDTAALECLKCVSVSKLIFHLVMHL